MGINRLLSALVVVAGIQSSGCATSDDSNDATATVASEIATGVQCTNKSWAINFLDDATHTTVVGTMSCSCFGPELLDGVESGFSVLVFLEKCDNR